MPKFIDSHPMQPFTADALKDLQKAPPDEFGVTHHDILFSENDNKIYCVLNGPNAEAIHKHHAKAGVKCEWVQEVKEVLSELGEQDRQEGSHCEREQSKGHIPH